MQAKKAKSVSRRLPPLGGRHIKKGVKTGILKTRRRKLSKGTSADTNRDTTPFALKPIGRSYFELQIKTFTGGSGAFSDPAEQLKIIKDLHPVVSALPGYKESKKWTEASHSGEVLHCILSQFEKITRSEGWEVRNNGKKYNLTGVEEYGSSNAQWISMRFLSKINVTHKKLHELIFYSFMLASKINGVGLPYDWVKMVKTPGHHGMTYEYLTEKDDQDPDSPDLQQWLEYYGPNGVPVAYLKMMQRPCSFKIWEQEYLKFRPSDAIERAATEYLKVAYDLMKTKMSMHNYCHNPYGEGLTPCEYMQIVWSCDNDDYMWLMHCEVTDDFHNSMGAMPFAWEINYGEKVDENKKIRDFCDLVRLFFVTGGNMSEWMEEKLDKVSETKPLKTKKKNVYLVDTII